MYVRSNGLNNNICLANTYEPNYSFVLNWIKIGIFKGWCNKDFMNLLFCLYRLEQYGKECLFSIAQLDLYGSHNIWVWRWFCLEINALCKFIPVGWLGYQVSSII